MKVKRKALRSLEYNELEKQSVFVERKLSMPTVQKNRKKFDKKTERQFRHDMSEK